MEYSDIKNYIWRYPIIKGDISIFLWKIPETRRRQKQHNIVKMLTMEIVQ